MSGRRLAGVSAVATAVLAGTVARGVHARRLARRLTGRPPSVLTEDGVRLHVEVEGPANAPVTVVCAHGFAARSTMVEPQRTALRDRARVVRYDQRGQGLSGWAGVRKATVPPTVDSALEALLTRTLSALDEGSTAWPAR